MGRQDAPGKSLTHLAEKRNGTFGGLERLSNRRRDPSRTGAGFAKRRILSAMYLLDTNTLAYYFKGMGNVSTTLLQKAPIEIGVPAIVVFEIEYGIAKSPHARKRLLQLQTLLQEVSVLDFGIEEAKAAAQIRASLDLNGEPIGPFDLLIAGTTVACGGILVTHNVREFSRIPHLRIEDWY
jgi:tRNA(fMet)-specific endonuclease VapC